MAATQPGFGERWVVDTTSPDALQSLVFTLPGEFTALGRFQYEIGVGTAEQPDIGFLFDSVTISLAQGDGSQSANLVTGDVFGLTVVPLSANGLLSGGGLTVQETSADTALLRNAPLIYAYIVDVSLPPSLAGRDLRTSFDFFNNGDTVPTTAYAMVVPEPSVRALAVVGCAFIAWMRLRQRRFVK